MVELFTQLESLNLPRISRKRVLKKIY